MACGRGAGVSSSAFASPSRNAAAYLAPTSTVPITSSPFHHYIYILYNTEITLFPAEDDGGGIPFRAAWVDTRVECCHRSNAAVSQTGLRHLREGAFDQIAPRARFGGMHLLKASRPGGQISHGFLRKVGRMMIQHPAHDGVRRSVTIQDLQ